LGGTILSISVRFRLELHLRSQELGLLERLHIALRDG
jgi:hypothetical protein